VWINGISLHFIFQGVLPLLRRDSYLFDTIPTYFYFFWALFLTNLFFRNAESDSGSDSESSEEEKKADEPKEVSDDEPKEESEAQKKQKEMIEKQRKA